jgi:ribosomal-protein-alanine N-acetyltransferase
MTVAARVTVREATVADLPDVHRLEKACFSDPWDEASIAAALTLPHMRSWVAERGEGSGQEVVGYVIGLMLGPESEVADLAVAPEYRGQGIGGLLLDHLLLSSAREQVEVVFLEVRESNSSARALYRSRGFREVGSRRAYYRNPVEDALLLRRDIGPA